MRNSALVTAAASFVVVALFAALLLFSGPMPQGELAAAPPSESAQAAQTAKAPSALAGDDSPAPRPERKPGFIAEGATPPAPSVSDAPSAGAAQAQPGEPIPDSTRPSASEREGLGGGTRRFAIDRQGIQAAMRSGVEDIRGCYAEWLRMQPVLAGRIRVRFTIDSEDGEEGRVTEVSLAEDAGVGNVAMEGCVLSVVSDLRFDAPPEGPMNVTYPFTFVSSDGGL